MTGALPVDDDDENVTVTCSGPGPPTVGRGVVNVQSGIVISTVYLNAPAMIEPSKSMTTSAVTLLITRVRFVLSLKSAVKDPDAVGLSVSAGFAMTPPDPSANASSRNAMPRVKVPSP